MGVGVSTPTIPVANDVIQGVFNVYVNYGFDFFIGMRCSFVNMFASKPRCVHRVTSLAFDPLLILVFLL
jgi:hypothetical protein